MSYNQRGYYPYQDQQTFDEYGQNRQQYADGYGQHHQQNVDGYGQNRQHSVDAYDQNRQYSVDGYDQNRQYSADGYGQHDVYSGQPGVHLDQQNASRGDNYGYKEYAGDQEEPSFYADPSNKKNRFAGDMTASPTLSESKLLVSPDSLKKPKRRPCWQYFLCRCMPVWARWICCSCLLIILGLLIAAAVIAATFKVPVITLNGVGQQAGVDPYVQNGTSFSFNFALKIGVVNNNIIGATFKKIEAVAYYPIDNTRVGGGVLNDVNFPAHATTNLTFPFSINYDPTMDKDQAVLNDIASKCGLLGGPETKKPIAINYSVTLYLRILFVTITPPSIKQSTSIDCPIQDGQLPPWAQGLTPSSVGLPPAATPTTT